MFKKQDPDSGRAAPMPDTWEQPSRRATPGETAVIGASIRIKGDLSGDEDLVLQGRVEGTINLKQHAVTVGADGHVKAQIQARVITVEGRVEGDLVAEEQVVLNSAAQVQGNILAPRVSLEDGCKFRGTIDMEAAGSSRSASGAKLASVKGAAESGGSAA